MPAFVVQGRLGDRAAMQAGVQALGATVRRSLDNLAALSGASILILDVPVGVGEAQLRTVPEVKIVEGEFYHPFYRLPPEPIPPPTPQEFLAIAIQLLPPGLYNRVPPAFLEFLARTKLAEAGALQPFDPRTLPLGAPGLQLGAIATQAEFTAAGDLASILSLIHAPQAQQVNMGQDAIVAVMDSGVDPRWVPLAQRMTGWGDTGQDPWTDTVGHGSMVAAILMAVAPQARVYPVKPGTSPEGAMSSMGTLSGLDHLAGLATQLNRPIITNHSWGIFGSKNLVLPCLPEGTHVMGKDGVKEVQDLVVGEEIWALEGKGLTRQLTKRGIGGGGHMRTWRRWTLDMEPILRKVVDKEYRGIKPVYQLRTRRRRIEATADHPFLKLSQPRIGQYILEWVPLSSLKAGDVIMSAKALPETGQIYQVGQNENNVKHITGVDALRPSVNLFWSHPWAGFEKVRSIKEVLAKPVFDIQVEGNGSFIAEGVVTHNCSVAITRVLRLLDERGLVMSVWAAGNNRHVVGRYSPSIYCMNSLAVSTAVGAVDRNLRPHFYSSLGPGQCFPAQPTVATPTFGILPWGAAYMNFADQGGGTSSCAPQVSGALAMMMTAHPNRRFRDYRAALRASADNRVVGLPPGAYYPATGFGLLQCDGAIKAVPYAQAHPSWAWEAANLSSVPPLGKEPQLK